MSETDRIRDLASGPNMSLPPKRNFCRQRANHVRMQEHLTLTLPNTQSHTTAADNMIATQVHSQRIQSHPLFLPGSARNSRPHSDWHGTGKQAYQTIQQGAEFPKKEPDSTGSTRIPNPRSHRRSRGKRRQDLYIVPFPGLVHPLRPRHGWASGPAPVSAASSEAASPPGPAARTTDGVDTRTRKGRFEKAKAEESLRQGSGRRGGGEAEQRRGKQRCLRRLCAWGTGR